jgi:hypothetical protein
MNSSSQPASPAQFDATTAATLLPGGPDPTVEVHSDPNNLTQVKLFLFPVDGTKPAAPSASGIATAESPFSWSCRTGPGGFAGQQIAVDLTLVRQLMPIGNSMQAWVHVLQAAVAGGGVQQIDDGRGYVTAPIPAAVAAPNVARSVLIRFG